MTVDLVAQKLRGTRYLTAFMVLANILWLVVSGRAFQFEELFLLLLFEAVVIAGYFYYARRAKDETMAIALMIMAYPIAFFYTLALFSYAVASLNLPLIDPFLDKLDRLCGFDWLYWYQALHNRPFLYDGLQFFYANTMATFFFIGASLIVASRFERLIEIIRLMTVSGFIMVLLSGLLPAVGAFGTYHIHEENFYVRQFLEIRAGGVKTVHIMQLAGIVQFPSYHFALAFLGAYATRGMRFLFPVACVWSLIVMLATPFIGGHFLADLLGSVIVLFLLIRVEAWVQKRDSFCWSQPFGKAFP